MYKKESKYKPRDYTSFFGQTKEMKEANGGLVLS